MRFAAKDFWSSIITGFVTGAIAWKIADFLEVQRIGGFSFAWLTVLVPVCWIIGVNFGYFLGQKIAFFNQFGKFVAVGFTNAAVDFGILYLLIAFSGVATGYYYAAFKALSFLIAALHSYLWNKFWVFDATATSQVGGELTKFFAVSVSAAIINVLVASGVVNILGPQLGLSHEAWAGIGAAIGSATALAVSFVGFRVIVFQQ